MKRARHRTRGAAASAALLLSIFVLVSGPAGFSQIPTSSPNAAIQEQWPGRKPISRSWKIAIVSAAIVTCLVAFAFSVRAWRAGNLFDREYRFPAVISGPIRLGGKRTGGCMATINFRDRGG
jgi:hypothetical protein